MPAHPPCGCDVAMEPGTARRIQNQETLEKGWIEVKGVGRFSRRDLVEIKIDDRDRRAGRVSPVFQRATASGVSLCFEVSLFFTLVCVVYLTKSVVCNRTTCWLRTSRKK